VGGGKKGDTEWGGRVEKLITTELRMWERGSFWRFRDETKGWRGKGGGDGLVSLGSFFARGGLLRKRGGNFLPAISMWGGEGEKRGGISMTNG